MSTAADQRAFEAMAQTSRGDAGALAQGLRRGITGVGLRALAARAVHVAAAAPERMADIFDNAAAGWLSGPVFPPSPRTEEPLPISPGFWRIFWDLVGMPADARRAVVADRLLMLAGELDPRINPRMARAALNFPGVSETCLGEIPQRMDLADVATLSPASLGYAARQAMAVKGGLSGPIRAGMVPLLRHMPAPLGFINVQVIQTLAPMSLVAGYSTGGLDQVAVGGFLMGQVGHHYSALATAVTLAQLSFERPPHLEELLNCVFKGWLHGRTTPLLIDVPWETYWGLRIDQVREDLGVAAFDSPSKALGRALKEEGQK